MEETDLIKVLLSRDLKLDNLVVDQYNVVKVIDFGTATVVRYPFDKVERQSSGTEQERKGGGRKNQLLIFLIRMF